MFLLFYLQQHSLNLTSDKWHSHNLPLEDRPKTVSFAFYQGGGTFIRETGRSQGQVEKDLQECFYIHQHPQLEASENTEVEANDPKPADGGDIQIEYLSS